MNTLPFLMTLALAAEPGSEIEGKLASRITEVLEPMIGMGRVVARVSAEIDHAKIEETSEQIDPEVSKTIRKTERAGGVVKRLSIAVVIDSNGPQGPSKTAVSELVKKAAGFDVERGDQIEVQYAPFSKAEVVTLPPVTVASPVPPTSRPFEVSPTALLAVILAGAAAWVARTKKQAAEIQAPAPAPAYIAPPVVPLAEAPAPKKSAREEIRNVGLDQVEITAAVLKDWLSAPKKRGS